MESTEHKQGGNGNGSRELVGDLDSEVQCAAAVTAPVLITAEERVSDWLARLIHERSASASGAFVVFTPETRNAAGALRALLSGRRQDALKGTVLIKRIDQAPIDVQRELSDAIGRQARGGRVQMRIITATSVWLLNRVDAGKFDERLFYRLNTLHIRVAGARPDRDKDQLRGVDETDPARTGRTDPGTRDATAATRAAHENLGGFSVHARGSASMERVFPSRR